MSKAPALSLLSPSKDEGRRATRAPASMPPIPSVNLPLYPVRGTIHRFDFTLSSGGEGALPRPAADRDSVDFTVSRAGRRRDGKRPGCRRLPQPAARDERDSSEGGTDTMQRTTTQPGANPAGSGQAAGGVKTLDIAAAFIGNNGTPQAASRKPQAASRKPQAASRKPQAASRKPQAASRKPQAASRKPQAASRKPQAASRKPQAASRKPQAASRKPQAASRKPQAASRKPHPSTGSGASRKLAAWSAS